MIGIALNIAVDFLPESVLTLIQRIYETTTHRLVSVSISLLLLFESRVSSLLHTGESRKFKGDNYIRIGWVPSTP